MALHLKYETVSPRHTHFIGVFFFCNFDAHSHLLNILGAVNILLNNLYAHT